MKLSKILIGSAIAGAYYFVGGVGDINMYQIK